MVRNFSSKMVANTTNDNDQQYQLLTIHMAKTVSEKRSYLKKTTYKRKQCYNYN